MRRSVLNFNVEFFFTAYIMFFIDGCARAYYASFTLRTCTHVRDVA